MYTICQTSHPATTVEFSIECRFYNPNENNLIVAGANQLSVYRIQAKLLEFVQSFEFYGTVASMQKVSLKSNRRDSLVLSFHDAKLSIVEYNPEAHDLKTISMHYFEDDMLRDGCVTNHISAPIVRVDPENRCISMLVYGRHIVIIPIYKDEEEEGNKDEANDSYDDASSRSSLESSALPPPKRSKRLKTTSGISGQDDDEYLMGKLPVAAVGQVAMLKPAVVPGSKSPVLPSYKIDLSEETCRERIDNIADIQFLHNYNDPTLVILHEPVRTWSGRIAMRQDTFSMVALSLNVHQRLQPIIWTVNNLPYDSLRILPVPKPIGGLLVVACNELIYLNQSVPAFGMSFNSFTKESSSFPLQNRQYNTRNIPSPSQISTASSPMQPRETMPGLDFDMDNSYDQEDLDNGHGKSRILSSGINVLISTDNSQHTNGDSNSLMASHNNDRDESKIMNQSSEMNSNQNLEEGAQENDIKIVTEENHNNSNNHKQDSQQQLVDHVNISLDLSQAVFLSHNKILFILKDGDVYLVTLFNDDMRSIKNFHFERVASTVQPNCLTLCEHNNLLFIGSHVGDSVLAEIVGDLKIGSEDGDSDSEHDDDRDSSLMSTPNEMDKEPVTLYEHDQIFSSSSSGRICYGEASNISESLHYDYRDPYVELITTAGHHKNGAVCVFQRSIKPVVQDTYELKDCGELWTMKPSKQSDLKNSRLILNRDYETMVFSTKGELLELKREECHFETREPTIYAANIGQENFTLQVLSSKAQLISNDKTIDTVEFGNKSTVCDACVADPHVIVLDRKNSIHHLELRSSASQNGDGSIPATTKTNQNDDQDVEMKPEDASGDTKPSINATGVQYGLDSHEIGQLTTGQIISLTIYKDISGLFSCDKDSDPYEMSYEDISKPTYWLLIVDDRGVLEIFSIPNFTLVYSVDNFPSMPSVLADNAKLFVTDLDANISKTKEILMTGLGRRNKRPLLFVRSEVELVVYEAYRFTEFNITNHLKIRFKKVHSLLLMTIIPDQLALELQPEQQLVPVANQSSLPMIGNEPSGSESHHHPSSGSNYHHHHHETRSNTKSRRQHRSSQARPLPNLRERWLHRRHWMREFKNIEGYNGVFLAGFRPHWFIMTDRCMLRVHPMNAEGAIYSFSQYDDNNFIYYTQNRELRVAKLSKQFNYDHNWPVRKLQMRETVHFVNYHVERKVYCVISSSPRPCSKIMRVGQEPDTMKIEDLSKEPGYIPPTTELFRLRLFDPENWEEIPDCEIEFEEWEQVTCVKNVQLASEGTKSGLKGYLAISTNYCYGEDVPNRGKIWILDLIEVVPEPDRPLTKNKIKKVYCAEQKGPVTTLSHTCGLLMSAVGQKIYLWQLKEEQLDGVAFIDTQVYIHCAASVKNLILVSDVCKSVTLLRYQQETRTLSMVCRDSKQLEVYGCDFTIDNEILNFVIADSEKNIIIYSHDPEHEDSFGGMRLIRKADYHLGAHLIDFCRIRGRVPKLLAHDPELATMCKRKQLTLFSTVDGAIGYLFPIHESTYKQFQMLANEMTMALPHVAGLNPKAWRSVKQARPTIANPCRGIIDGDLINRFLTLSTKERNELTRKIGTTTDRILADIQLIHESTMYF